MDNVEARPVVYTQLTDVNESIRNNKQMIQKLQAELERLNEEQFSLLEQKDAVMRMEAGSTYYHLDINKGCLIATSSKSGENDFDNGYLEDTCIINNNYFASQARVCEVLNRVETLLLLERLHDIYCPNYVPDWDRVSQPKYFICPDKDGKWGVYTTNTLKHLTVYFDSAEIAEEACRYMNAVSFLDLTPSEVEVIPEGGLLI